MAFVLKITNPAGGTYTYDENGLTLFASKYQAATAVLRALPEIHRWSSDMDARSLGRELEGAPLGTEVAIASGYKFKIEKETTT